MRCSRRRLAAFALLGIVLVAPLAAKELATGQGASIDMPSGFAPGEGDGRTRFAYFDPVGEMELDILVYEPARFAAADAMAADAAVRLDSHGDTSLFTYSGREAALSEIAFTLDGVARKGYAPVRRGWRRRGRLRAARPRRGVPLRRVRGARDLRARRVLGGPRGAARARADQPVPPDVAPRADRAEDRGPARGSGGPAMERGGGGAGAGDRGARVPDPRAVRGHRRSVGRRVGPVLPHGLPRVRGAARRARGGLRPVAPRRRSHRVRPTGARVGAGLLLRARPRGHRLRAAAAPPRSNGAATATRGPW